MSRIHKARSTLHWGAIRILCIVGAFLSIFCISFLNAQTMVAPLRTPSASSAVPTSHDDVTVVPGDTLSITVFDTPEFSSPVRVSNDGTIDVPLIGKIYVAGLSTTSIANLIRERLIVGNFLINPQVAVNFEDLTNHSAILLGEVTRPGPVPLIGVRRLWEVIGAAGGVTPIAGTKVTILHRGNSPAPSIFSVDWNRDLVGQPDPLISPGDTIQISRAGVVYVLGEVLRQGGYPITHQRMTVSEAIALAEGIKYTSKASHAQLVRSTSSTRVVSELNIPAIIKGKIPDVILQDNDIIYVPNSASKVAILRGLQAAVGITSSVIVYRNQ